MNIQTPPSWRKGQTIFNFLEWLSCNKGLDGTQGVRMADPFHLSDEEFDQYWDEYMETKTESPW